MDMPIWIKSRDVNGNYGYRNLETGQFRTSIPGSVQEKQQSKAKLNKAVLKTHSTRQAKFDNTEAKRRNHSDERIKKVTRKPVIKVNKEGQFQNNYQTQLAPSEESTRSTYPEFDAITLATGIKPTRKILDIATRKKTYTGVPHRIKSDGTFMDESFLTAKDKFDIWTSDNPDFVTQYASNGGQKFAIFGKSNKLFNLPRLNRKIIRNWQDMPYQIIDGKIIVNPNVKVKPINNITGKQLGKTYQGKLYYTPGWQAKLDKLMPFPEPEVTTNQLLKAIPSKYQGIKFNNLLDGPTIINGNYYNIPVNEWVYKAGADVIKAPFNTTKLDLMKNDLINLGSRISTIVGHNVIKNDE